MQSFWGALETPSSWIHFIKKSTVAFKNLRLFPMQFQNSLLGATVIYWDGGKPFSFQ